MEGWRMILLVNGGVFLFMAFSAYGIAGLTGECNEDPDVDCDPSAGIAGTMRNVAIGLVIVGIVLLILGAALKRPRPPQP